MNALSLFSHASFRWAVATLATVIPQLASAAEEASGASNLSLWAMIGQGGWAMIPLGVCSLALLYLIIHCFKETRASKFGTDLFASRLVGLCENGKLEDAQLAARQEPSALGRCLSKGLRKIEPSFAPECLENAQYTVDEAFEIEEHAVAQWIHYLGVIAAVSPMIGLLGTVSGMIGAFQTMSSGGMGRPELLAGDIGEALITTATGLCIGIPAMIAHSYFSNRLNGLVVENDQRAAQAIEAFPRGPEAARS